MRISREASPQASEKKGKVFLQTKLNKKLWWKKLTSSCLLTGSLKSFSGSQGSRISNTEALWKISRYWFASQMNPCLHFIIGSLLVFGICVPLAIQYPELLVLLKLKAILRFVTSSCWKIETSKPLCVITWLQRDTKVT